MATDDLQFNYLWFIAFRAEWHVVEKLADHDAVLTTFSPSICLQCVLHPEMTAWLVSVKLLSSLTWKELKPTANVEHCGWAEEEEEEHDTQAYENGEHGEAYECGRRAECWVQYRTEVFQLAFANNLMAALKWSAVLPQTKVTALHWVSVPDPLRLDENDNINYCKAKCKNPPQDADSFGILQVMWSVHLTLFDIFNFGHTFHHFHNRFANWRCIYFRSSTKG